MERKYGSIELGKIKIEFRTPERSQEEIERMNAASDALTRIHFINPIGMSVAERDQKLKALRETMSKKSEVTLTEVAELVALQFYDNEIVRTALLDGNIIRAIEWHIDPKPTEQRLDAVARELLDNLVPNLYAGRFASHTDNPIENLDSDLLASILNDSETDHIKFRACEILSSQAIWELMNSVSSQNHITLADFGASVLFGLSKKPKRKKLPSFRERDTFIVRAIESTTKRHEILATRNKDNPIPCACGIMSSIWNDFSKYAQGLNTMSYESFEKIWNNR